MQAQDLRQKFLSYFERQGHLLAPSSSLVPADDPTLLFVNAGMVQFKKSFLGSVTPPAPRVTTAQKCVRAGGKHNDLEQVGHTARHHTFFEMMGNFSFGDYFKRDAIRFAWDFLTNDLGLDPKHLRVTVFHEDDEARQLWREIAGLSNSRIYGLGAHDNFWQMADTGPCGPCSEIYIDLAHVTRDWRFPDGAKGEWTELEREEFSEEAFVEGAEAGRFLEFWNLVFMQFDRKEDGTVERLPAPSVDTGLGLDRVAAFLQGVTSNYHTDLFLPLIAAVETVTGIAYRGRDSDESYLYELPRSSRSVWSGAVIQGKVKVEPAAFRVIADHARAVAFLLGDGVFPSNEGRGYVLRRILRRAVRHAWLLGRAVPTLVHVVERVIDVMGDAYPELRERRQSIIDTTRAEEERFLATIEGGIRRFDELAPPDTTQGSTALRGTIAGEDAFRLYDTFGFPIDLTELMARERGYTVDLAGFESALANARSLSQRERKSKGIGVAADGLSAVTWQGTAGASDSKQLAESVAQLFVGYDRLTTETEVAAHARLDDGRVAVVLRETPFYVESGGQISDHGLIQGEGWSVNVEEMKRADGIVIALGKATGEVKAGPVRASVPRDMRLDTERNHTATHLLHAALRQVLGDHVHQAGSLVAPDRLRFDFTHHGPMKDEQLAEVSEIVNRGILDAVPIVTVESSYREALASGAMALFGEKYGDVVRVVRIPGLSAELCGGTHVRNTAEISRFRIVSETGVAAGVRRIDAVTGRRAYEMERESDRALDSIAQLLRSPPSAVPQRIQSLVEERKTLQKRLDEAMRGGGGEVDRLIAEAVNVEGVRVIAASVTVSDAKSLTTLADVLRDKLESGVAVLAASPSEGKSTLVCIVTDDLRARGIRADVLLKEIAAIAGGRGGGKPHIAQAGVPDATRIPDALAATAGAVRRLLGA
jgi:alanyl-tRNA synthetase